VNARGVPAREELPPEVRTLAAQGHASVHVLDLHAAAARRGAALERLPYVIRILLENLCRHRIWRGDSAVADAEIARLADWRRHIGADLPLHVERVLLPDSSGLPVLQDLAALRDAVSRAGGDPTAVDARLPVDLVVDHSLQVDAWRRPDALAHNMRLEFRRNSERYRFLRWAEQAFGRLRVFPPGTGIVHQVNLEFLATVVATTCRDGRTWAFPDFVIGGDSHTPMVNALGVLGWGVGGIDAEAALLGRSYTFPIPEVVGVRLVGEAPAAAYTTDVALLITEALRQARVANGAVEFFGPAAARLPVAERATIANMAPEYGATCGLFPIDEQTLTYLRQSARTAAHVDLVRAYARANALYRDDAAPAIDYARVVEVDLGRARPSLAGPRRPQDRLPLDAVASDFRHRLHASVDDGGFGAPAVAAAATPAIPHGAVVIASITSCTNTSNPSVMLAAGLVARRAVARGLSVPPWVKTSLAPGSRAVTRYLERAGLLAPLAALGFDLVGYGCTTCAGKSGPLAAEVAAAIEGGQVVAAAVLSGNRNFEGRIHRLVRANYIGAPPLVVLYALAGRIDIDFAHEPVGTGADGRPVFFHDLLPDPAEVRELLPLANDDRLIAAVYAGAAEGEADWRALPVAGGERFAWDPASTYLVEPPFFGPADAGTASGLPQALHGARVLALFDDSLTTDHISPGGEIPPEAPAGLYLRERGVAPGDFNTYVGRRGNFEVMVRATFANVRLRNQLVPGLEGGFTRLFPEGRTTTIFEAAGAYRQADVPMLVLAGKEYGTGSSRDWAAKGMALLGVRAVLAESFERIHRANLVGMGMLPLAFRDGQSWRSLRLTGEECIELRGVADGVRHGRPIVAMATQGDRVTRFELMALVATEAEKSLVEQGGLMRSVLAEVLAAGMPATSAAATAGGANHSRWSST